MWWSSMRCSSFSLLRQSTEYTYIHLHISTEIYVHNIISTELKFTILRSYSNVLKKIMIYESVYFFLDWFLDIFNEFLRKMQREYVWFHIEDHRRQIELIFHGFVQNPAFSLFASARAQTFAPSFMKVSITNGCWRRLNQKAISREIV